MNKQEAKRQVCWEIAELISMTGDDYFYNSIGVDSPEDKARVEDAVFELMMEMRRRGGQENGTVGE